MCNMHEHSLPKGDLESPADPSDRRAYEAVSMRLGLAYFQGRKPERAGHSPADVKASRL